MHLHGAFNRTTTVVSSSLMVPDVFSPHGGYDPISLQRSTFRKQAYLMLFERSMLRKAAIDSPSSRLTRSATSAPSVSGRRRQ